MQDSELDTFLLLETDPQRDIYIADFWHRRDKLQGTTNHTFRDQYYERLETVKEKFRNVSSDPGRIYLIHGEPAEIIESDCRLLVPIQVWKYLYIPGLGHNVRFVFFQNRFGGDWRLWVPIGISQGIDFDSLSELVSQDVVDEIVDRGMLEVLPLTHIRGRSLHDAFVIVDEAQSLERGVLLTVLSRIGQNSRVVLTHDVAQRHSSPVPLSRRQHQPHVAECRRHTGPLGGRPRGRHEHADLS